MTVRARRPLRSLLASLLLTACGDGGSTPNTSSLHDAATADAATDTPPGDASPDASRCPAHTHEVSPGRCDVSLSFSEGTALTTPRDHHGTAIVASAAGPALVVTGGAAILAGAHDQTPIGTVLVAPILADGTVGAWTDGPALPGPRAGHAVGVIDDVLILAGGRAGSFLRSTTLARAGADGALGAWSTGSALPAARFHCAGATSGRWFFVSGGLGLDSGGSTASARADVWGARLDADGTLGAWQSLTALPEPISHHASWARDGFLYVAGGLGGDPFNDRSVARRNVYRARIAADGALGAWETVNALPAWISTHAAALHHDHVYLVGGVADSRENSDVIYRARFDADGALGAWEQFATRLPEVRAHLHHAPVRDGVMYLVSGSMEPHTPVATTLLGRFE